jgi:hypothetical protein
LQVAGGEDTHGPVVFLRKALGFVAGFILVAALIHLFMPRRTGLVDEHLRKGLAAREHCEVLFVGPSYVFSNIDTRVFDDEAEKLGFPVRSCKFGVSALKGYDLKRSIERLFEHDWPRLKLVVIDITLGTGVAFAEENWFKERVLEWHTWESIPWLFDYYYATDERRWSKKGPLLWAHLQHVLARYTHLGGGRELLEDARPLERLVKRRTEQVNARPAGEIVRDRKRIKGEAHTRRVELLKKNKAKRRAPKKSRLGDWSLELRDHVRSHGLEAYFLFASVYTPKLKPKQAGRGRDRLVVLDFNDPTKYPDLYREDSRGFTHHLNRKGTAIYSRLLARELQSVGLPR